MPIPLIGISASRGSAVLGVNKYKTPLVAWLEIMEQKQPGFVEGNGFEKPDRIDPWSEPLNPKHASLRFGTAFEDAICDLTGGITDREKVYIHPKHDFLTCHIDGLKNGRLQENKTAFDMAFKMGWGEPGSDMIPEMYQTQIQQQSMLSGIKGIDVNVLVFPKSPAEWEKMGYRINKTALGYGIIKDEGIRGFALSTFEWASKLAVLGYFHKYHIEANLDLQKAMLERYLEFWNTNVLKEIPPPVTGYDDIKWLIAAPEGEIQIDTSEETNPDRFEEHAAVKSMWSEYVDIDNEIESMVERKKEIKNNFAGWIQREIQSKNIKPGNEKRKLNIYAGPRKLFSATRAFPGLSVNKSMVATLKETEPDLYEVMKKTSFADIMPDELELTEKQSEKVELFDKTISDICEKLETETILSKDDMKIFENISKEHAKILKSFKLTKLLSKDSIMKHLEKHKPQMFNFFYERGIVEQTNPKSTLRISKPEKE